MLHQGSAETGLCRWMEGPGASSWHSSELPSEVGMGSNCEEKICFHFPGTLNGMYRFYWLSLQIKTAKFKGHLRAECGKMTSLFVFKVAFGSIFTIQNTLP